MSGSDSDGEMGGVWIEKRGQVRLKRSGGGLKMKIRWSRRERSQLGDIGMRWDKASFRPIEARANIEITGNGLRPSPK